MPHAQAPSLVGEVLDGRYKIIRKLGEGGMGEVYAAEHVHIEKRFAIKLLRPEIVSNAEAVQRFRQEARSSSSIGHRNIIAIEDFGQMADGRIYMCMELLNGAALNDLIQTPISPDRLLNILIQTGHGLAAAHAKGIVHRDMKPENIFVTIGPTGEDVPKILDFGIAKVAGNDGQNNLTRTGTIFGTPFYMAPEQALGNPVDARTDIYAMGVIMYELFAGSLPFQGESFMGILTQHITTDPEPVAQRAARAGRPLPVGLAEIITRCMQKNPAHRFSTMDELVNALIQIYRGIAGPGMSTYMEAFPVSQHHATPTPPPLTGPVQVPGANPHAPTAPPTSGYALPPPTGSASVVYDAGGSAVYAPPKKSKTAIIIAILAVLAVGGGVTAFALMGGGSGPDKGDPGSGSDKGSGIAVAGSPDAAVAQPAAIDAASPGAPDAGEATIDAGSPVAPADAPEAAPADAASVEELQVLIKGTNVIAFEVWEDEKDGEKLFTGTEMLSVVPGQPRKIVIKARGYKDKKLVIDGTKRTVEFSLTKIAGTGPGLGPGPGPGPGPGSNTPPPGVDCRNVIVDPKNKSCVKQYCSHHPSDARCDAE
ncbi:MAG: serine/threonine protein kinase [Kofleriaceae bacterium]